MRFVLNASQMDLWVRFLFKSRPINPINGCGVSNNSGGSIFASEGTDGGGWIMMKYKSRKIYYFAKKCIENFFFSVFTHIQTQFQWRSMTIEKRKCNYSDSQASFKIQYFHQTNFILINDTHIQWQSKIYAMVCF